MGPRTFGGLEVQADSNFWEKSESIRRDLEVTSVKAEMKISWDKQAITTKSNINIYHLYETMLQTL